LLSVFCITFKYLSISSVRINYSDIVAISVADFHSNYC
jgi:hypothetical protein